MINTKSHYLALRIVSNTSEGYQGSGVVILAHLQEDSLHGSRGRIGQRVMTGCCPAMLQGLQAVAIGKFTILRGVLIDVMLPIGVCKLVDQFQVQPSETGGRARA